jgi:hypothetical protein
MKEYDLNQVLKKTVVTGIEESEKGIMLTNFLHIIKLTDLIIHDYPIYFRKLKSIIIL